jgi:pyruvate/2-oxoglutarate dehydrogenase complex dihydrolipoamide dehydrogenase (E3) component
MNTKEYDLVAVGGGTAGLVAAAGAAYLGASPALVEKHLLGGDCLWTGCVPSKAFIAASRLAHAMRHADRLGLDGADPGVHLGRVLGRVKEARERVAHHDDPERFRQMGVEVQFGSARFVGPDTLEVEGVGLLRSKRIVIATGARPSIPPIPGLEEAGYETHETVFDMTEMPNRLAILGAGPIGLEFAQTFSRLGAQVTVLEMLDRILPKEDTDVAKTLLGLLENEGIAVQLSSKVVSVETDGGAKVLLTEDGRRFTADQILVAVGRRPNTERLDLEKAGVETSGGAVKVDPTLRTTNPKVWASGDVTGGLQFTHVADYMSKLVLRNSIFPFRSRADYRHVPWVTYTDPEVAHVGLSEEDADEKGGRTYTYEFEDLDRAITDSETAGFVKISADKKGRILGASILGHGAGNLMQPIVLAMKNGLRISKLSDVIYPYPTMVEGVKRAADVYQRARLEGRSGRILRKVVSWLT